MAVCCYLAAFLLLFTEGHGSVYQLRARQRSGSLTTGDLAFTNSTGGPVPLSGTCADTDAVHCVKVASLPEDFCFVTNQPNWCAAHVGQPWCICNWAYTSYTSSGKQLSIDCAGTACLSVVRDNGQCT
mmetsp:Transcript_121870/g.191272  ORF Transcript_121870/g.191272 Transcript_121870/m.191272 type:complete len:128 (+) Transcript_121870:49-432(+)